MYAGRAFRRPRPVSRDLMTVLALVLVLAAVAGLSIGPLGGLFLHANRDAFRSVA